MEAQIAQLSREVADLKGKLEVKEITESHRLAALTREVQSLKAAVDAGPAQSAHPAQAPVSDGQLDKLRMETTARIEELRQEISASAAPPPQQDPKALESKLTGMVNEQIEARLAKWRAEELGPLPERLADAVAESEARSRAALEQLRTQVAPLLARPLASTGPQLSEVSPTANADLESVNNRVVALEKSTGGFPEAAAAADEEKQAECAGKSDVMAPMAIGQPAEPADAAKDVVTLNFATTGLPLEEQVQFHRVHRYSMNASTWDVCMFVGLSCVNAVDSCLIVIGCTIGLIAQAVFCIIVLTTMTDDPLTNKDLEQIRHWRLFTGHNAEYYEPISNTSLVARVCADSKMLSLAGQQAQLFNDLAGFTQSDQEGILSTFNGRFLCGLVLTLWVLAIHKECVNIVQYVHAVHSKCCKGRSIIAMEGGTLVIKALSRRRCALLYALNVVPRLGVAILLFISGMLFLGHTASLGDLLLNALALTFILDIDDILFLAIVPASARFLQETCEPIELGHMSREQKAYKFGDITVMFTLVFVTMMVWAMDHTLVMPFAAHMKTVTTALCEGDVDFIVAMNPGTNMMYSAATAPASSTKDSVTGAVQYRKLAMLQRTDGPQSTRLPTELSLWGDNPRPHSQDAKQKNDAFVVATVQEVMDLKTMSMMDAINSMSCLDTFHEDDDEPLPWVLAAEQASNYYFDLDSTKSCETLTTYCDSSGSPRYYRMVRALCPLACGCASPEAGTFDLSGCSQQCQSLRVAVTNQAAQEIYCEDRSVEELANLPGWKLYMSEYAKYLEDEGLLETTLEALELSSYTLEALEAEIDAQGCTTVTDLRTYAVVDPCSTNNPQRGSATYFCPAACGSTCPPSAVRGRSAGGDESAPAPAPADDGR